jgi:hypothetical protein
MIRQHTLALLFTTALLLPAGCGDDDGTEADRLGIAAQCTKTEDCQENLECLTSFKGGYCGLAGCKKDADCPQGSACVDEGGNTFCFRVCTDKTQCNANRKPDFEANCSSSVTFVEAQKLKACVPPSG